ncbi:pentapeptide MXKDX repeat protein [Rhizobium sp. AN70]|uniref:pentapeptide MXKDX repeat protein n=1 Tax=Rhizobium sp. AN70 TaxID=3035123 RepID=UPI00247A9F6A|nr:pentapeptide MXKDX repeat protein [Rhizobium sp. AN70]MDH7801578.1 pentapeptide MXKDX repeat protein [Rhizobium sp. AN70]
MTRIFAAIATASMLSVLSFAGIAHADSMKTDTMKMHHDTMKMQTMKKGGMSMAAKKDCMHKADMEMNKMKKAHMMKTCDTMK